MEKDWVFFANAVLKKITDVHPGIVQYGNLLECDDHWRDHQKEIEKGIHYLMHHNLIVEIPLGSNNYRCSTEGLQVYQENIGIEGHRGKKTAEEENSYQKTFFEIELLKGQLTELTRKNKYWVWTAVASFISLVLTLLQIFQVF